MSKAAPTIDLAGGCVLVTLPLTEEQKRDFGALVETANGTCAFVPANEVTAQDVHDAAVILGNVPADMLREAQQLQWLQTSSAGYDHYLAVLPEGALLTCASGAYGQAVSEHMLAQLLCLMKKLHLYRDNQHAGAWTDEGPVTTLVGAKVLVLGTGDLGSSFARLVCALGAEAWGVRRKVSEPVEPFTQMYSLDQLTEVLPQADIIASVLPSTPQTKGLANADFFSAMKQGAFFVNAGRGDLVVSEDLCAALASGHLAGAALDVTNPEPLPADHPLWQQPNAFITPHISGWWHLQATVDNVVGICRSNLEAYLSGKPLRNVV